MVFIDSEMEPLPSLRGNMIYQFFMHPESPPTTRSTPSTPNTPPPSRKLDTPHSPSDFEEPCSIFITRATPSPELLDEDNSSEDGDCSGSDASSDSTRNSYVQHDGLDQVHLAELAAARHCSISKKFPNLVSPSDYVQKMQSADDRDICKGP